MPFENPAPGWPGGPARWTSSAKSGVGTALTARSRVWFTVSHGILNEVYYPRIDQACTRDFGLLVTNGKDFFSEEKRDSASIIRPVADGVPAFSITSSCHKGHYRIEKLILADPRRDVVLQRVAFHPLTADPYHLYALLAPHLVNRGAGNTAWVDDYKGTPMLFAEARGVALAVGCSAPFLLRSAGFVGASDGWQDLTQHFEMRWRYDHARDGNVALMGEIDMRAGNNSFVLALGFGQNAQEAAQRVRSSLSEGVDSALARYVAQWQDWQNHLLPLDLDSRPSGHNGYRVSAAVLRTHEAKSFVGGYIASLSVPWGFSKGDDDLGGYHLVWPRDLVQTAGGLLAIGAKSEAREVIHYLRAIQEADGHWAQNNWLDGTAYWNGVQMDECAFPILLADLAHREGALTTSARQSLWPMARQAAAYLMRHGPVTGQDRWEEDGGYSPFTLAVEIAALLAAADLADQYGTVHQAAYLRDTADIWNAMIESRCYATNTTLANQLGVEGYYVRIAPPDQSGAAAPLDGFVPIKNRPDGDNMRQAALTVSPDALALVRFGLRAPDDPRILNTLRVIDAILKADLPTGPCWYRYNGDGYGEHDDGGPFDGTGIGRPWPLLTAERAHYELAAGNVAGAKRLLHALDGFASDGFLLPEQVWDKADLPERELFLGRPSGSAMPLVWAHAEYVKLLRSLADGRVFDMPPQTHRRYVVEKRGARYASWRPDRQAQSMKAGLILRIELPAAASIHWSTDSWAHTQDQACRDSGFEIHYADLDTAALGANAAIVFTIRWTAADRWAGTDYRVAVI
jgi:glucoamylase